MIWLVILMMLGSCGACVLAFIAESRRPSLAARLGEVDRTGKDGAPGGVFPGADDQGETSPAWLAGLAEFGEALAGNDKNRDKQRAVLTQAGLRRDVALGLFMFVKTGLGLVLMMAALFLTEGPLLSLGKIALCLGLFVVGGIIPEAFLKGRAAKRRNSIVRSIPDAMDLMVICAEAGLPFTRIVKVVAKEIELSAPVLAEELAVTSAELQILSDRSTALRHLAERTRVPAVESMVATLVQAERYGTPLAQALGNIAAESRNTLILGLEERAGKLPARLSIPLMTLILPPIVALVATPALMRVIRSLLQ